MFKRGERAVFVPPVLFLNYLMLKGLMKRIGVIGTNCIAILLALVLPVILCAAPLKAAETGDRLSAEAEGQTALEEENPLVGIRVEGRLEETDRQLLLERLNEIRMEACREGVQNPVNGEPLGLQDYVPLEWSAELESIAVQRAVESTILQDHLRPDGTECFTAAPKGVSYTMETLAWGFGSAADAIEGWYSEKAEYVGETGYPAGHYIALINPENRFVGIADLRADWQRDACAGAFASHGRAGFTEDGLYAGEREWKVPLLREYLPQVIERAVELTAGSILRAAQFRR